MLNQVQVLILCMFKTKQEIHCGTSIWKSLFKAEEGRQGKEEGEGRHMPEGGTCWEIKKHTNSPSISLKRHIQKTITKISVWKQDVTARPDSKTWGINNRREIQVRRWDGWENFIAKHCGWHIQIGLSMSRWPQNGRSRCTEPSSLFGKTFFFLQLPRNHDHCCSFKGVLNTGRRF